MSGKSKAVPFHGILAMGNTKDEAVNRYRLLALGKGVSAMKDAGGKFAFVTHASNKIAEVFNPQTGELDLSKDASILNKLQFEAKAGEIEANYYHCEAGCGLHLVYDSNELVQKCPSCTTAIASDDDEDSEDDESEEEGEDADTDADAEDEDADDESEDEDYDSESSDDEDEESEEDEDDSSDDDEEDEESDEDSEDDSEGDEDDSEEDEDDSEEDEGDDEEEEDDSGEPLVIAADSKEKAIEIYRQNRSGIATAATTVEVEYVLCSSKECGAHIISEDTSLSACPACKSEIQQPETEAAPAAAPAPTAQAGAEGQAQAGEDEDEDDEEGSDLNVIPDDEDSEDDDGEDEDSSESKDAAAESNTQVEQNQQPKETMNVENVTVNMLSQLNDSGEGASKGLDVSFSASVAGSPMWTAYFNGQPIATAAKTDAGVNADIFEKPAFGNAVIASAKELGVKATLTEMGFKGIAHEISLNAVVADRVNSQVAEAKAGLDRDRQEHAERLMAALATAAIGINRGFFQDAVNPVKAALWNAMSSAGVKNAEVLIDNAFRASSDDYHRSLFAKASEIIGQPLEVQESLSKAVLGTNYMNAATASAENGTAFEDRLELGRSTATASAKEEAQKPNHQESMSSDTNERITRTIAGLGRRRS